jgi:hypothetical protein
MGEQAFSLAEKEVKNDETMFIDFVRFGALLGTACRKLRSRRNHRVENVTFYADETRSA